MKYSAEISCVIEMMVEIPPMFKLPTKPTLEGFKAADTTEPSAISEVPEEFEDLYIEQLKMYAKKLDKFEKDVMQAYLMVVGQCADDMLYELECDTEYEVAKKGYNVVKLVVLIKKIWYSYKLQNHSLVAITKPIVTMYSTKQKENESISYYLLSLKNRLSMFEAVGGNLIDQGVRKHISEKLFKK